VEPAELIDGLRRPSAYPHPAGGFEVHRTHISLVFLAGDYAYKIKKSVDLGFLDYSTLERRLHFCREEVRLNRRLAPDVYLGVAAVVRRGGELRVEPGAAGGTDGDGAAPGDDAEVVEWAVRMRRLPEDRTLQARLERDEVDPAELEDLAVHLAAFHGEARRGPEVARYGRFEVVAENARDNFTQSEDQVGRTIRPKVFERLSALTEAALERHRALIEARAERGVPRDTHGDLRLDHVYFLPDRDRPVVVDCIEFNPAFRFADPISDMAFLVMDLQQVGRRQLADRFADAYVEASGDDEGRALLDFYVAYRAAVRGKVQGIKADDDGVAEEEREAAAATATGHWLLALGALAPPRERPGLVLVGGLPGTGKTTLARALADAADFRTIRSDEVRKELAGLEPEASAAADYGEGIYGPDWTDRTYASCRERAREALLEGGRVVVDASFHRPARRRPFLDTAVRLGVRVRFLVCRADAEVVRRRLATRTDDASDADPEVYRRMAERWEPPGPSERRVTRTVPTGGERDASLARAMEALREAGLA
jgi:aminoglycoside phosphotransferase family enzyme/predicted kinase